jgi:prephenate dehydrogenase
MGEECAGEVVGLHPMFGPTVRSLRRQKVVICPVRQGEQAAWFRQELSAIGLELIDTDPETHDRMMAIVQVLVHFSTMVMGDALRRTGVDIDESLRFTSPVYRLELAFVGRLFAQNPDLYAEIEMSNPHANEVRALFIESASEIEALSRGGDRRAFRERFEEVARWFHGFQDEAMRLSDRVIDAMIRLP